MKKLTDFDMFEVNPLVGLDSNNNPTNDKNKITGYDHCDEDDPNIALWIVFGRAPGVKEVVAECPSKEFADAIYDELSDFLLQIANLPSTPKFS